ncbi:MAG: tetraacyldisaccharide 4'-kinase, partial [Betaproteobacteria bacterium]
PAGPLREPVARIAAADAVVINGGDAAARSIAGIPPPVFMMRLTGGRLVSLSAPARSIAASDLRGKRVHALAGIGNPERFFATLRALGLEPVCHPFPDHHRYSADDLRLPEAEAIVMTDKDAIKCTGIADARMWRLPVAAEVEPGLIELILEKLHGRETA